MNKHTRSVSLIDGHTEEITDAEVIKALEDTIHRLKKYSNNLIVPKEGILNLCNGLENALDLINRQQAEIERLNNEVDRLSQCVMYHDGHIVDVVKAFAERLCEGRVSNDPVVIAVKTELKMTEVSENG